MEQEFPTHEKNKNENIPHFNWSLLHKLQLALMPLTTKSPLFIDESPVSDCKLTMWRNITTEWQGNKNRAF